ncbi:MAG: hypothetical protein ISEC1_P1362 [Thiomicrorhabdus sp.]|nr:MAG: hypothetical protein ISEC1_P1362 [Thiomicrorhabdus sp.]
MLFKTSLNLCLLALMLIFVPLKADMRVDSTLNFGSIAIRDNSQVWLIQQFSDGSVAVDSGFVILEPGNAGQYFFYNLPASTQISFLIVDGVGPLLFSGGSPQAEFTVEPYLDFSTYTTDSNGELTLPLPGVLKTSGDGLSYVDGVYYRFFELSINY